MIVSDIRVGSRYELPFNPEISGSITVVESAPHGWDIVLKLDAPFRGSQFARLSIPGPPPGHPLA